MIVSFSGIDSAGKTTQIDLLYDYCKKNNISVKKMWSKARGTPGVLFLKELVRRDKGMSKEEKKEYRDNVFKNSKKQKLLYIASMLDLCWYWGIYYRLCSLTCRILICDRYLWDTYVEINRDFADVNIDKSVLWKMVKALAPIPKHSFMFVIPPEVSIQRDIEKNAAGIENIEIKKIKIDKYMSLVEKKAWTNVMDGLRGIDDLHKDIIQELNI